MSASQPLVSVVIPTYNDGEVLGEAVESVLNQTYRNIECVIINDASVDNTGEVAKSYAAKDSRVHVYHNDKNLGLNGNRRRGVELAKGEFICWQDGDDISMPQRIEHQVKYLQEHPTVGIVGGYLEFFGEGIKKSMRKYAEDDASLRRAVFRYSPVAQPAAMCRAECYKRVGSYDPAFPIAEDLEMSFRIGTEYQFANLQEVVVRYRQLQRSATRRRLREMELITLKVRRKYSKHSAYKPTLLDYMYNVAQLISVYVVPARLKISLFNFFRNS